MLAKMLHSQKKITILQNSYYLQVHIMNCLSHFPQLLPGKEHFQHVHQVREINVSLICVRKYSTCSSCTMTGKHNIVYLSASTPLCFPFAVLELYPDTTELHALLLSVWDQITYHHTSLAPQLFLLLSSERAISATCLVCRGL